MKNKMNFFRGLNFSSEGITKYLHITNTYIDLQKTTLTDQLYEKISIIINADEKEKIVYSMDELRLLLSVTNKQGNYYSLLVDKINGNIQGIFENDLFVPLHFPFTVSIIEKLNNCADSGKLVVQCFPMMDWLGNISNYKVCCYNNSIKWYDIEETDLIPLSYFQKKKDANIFKKGVELSYNKWFYDTYESKFGKK